MAKGAEAVEYITSRCFGNLCNYTKDLKSAVKHDGDFSKDYKIDCSTFHKGVLTKGLFAALNSYLSLAQELSTKIVYFAENKEADWNPDYGPCTPTASLPKFRSNLRCILVSSNMITLSRIFPHRLTSRKFLQKLLEPYQ